MKQCMLCAGQLILGGSESLALSLIQDNSECTL